MKTRAKKGASSKQDKVEQPTSQLQQLDPSVSNPPKVFILPRNTSQDARIVTLLNPATSAPCRYLLCPDKGFYEITRIAAPKRACRSWLLASEHIQNGHTMSNETVRNGPEDSEGYILQTPEMMVATPIDPIFLLLPALAQDGQKKSTNVFLTSSDYLDTLGEKSAHFKELMRNDRESECKLASTLEKRIQAVCDEVEAGDEKLYRLSNEKLHSILWSKAKRMVEHGLPPSMEEHFVEQALVVPVMSVKREESSISIATDDEPGEATTGASQTETAGAGTSQDTQDSSTTATSTSTAATSTASNPADRTTDLDIPHLLRLRTAYTFLTTSYVPTSVRSILSSLPSPVNFAPLDAHLTHLAKLKSDAQALRTMSENISRKRGIDDDEEALERAEAKKRKKEEEEFKKKNTSRGVQQLKKADTTGMKKLSSFFTKAAVKK